MPGSTSTRDRAGMHVVYQLQQPGGHAHRPASDVLDRQVVHVELRPRAAGRWRSWLRADRSSRTTGRSSATASIGAHAGRPRHTRRDRSMVRPGVRRRLLGFESDSRKRVSVSGEQRAFQAARRRNGVDLSVRVRYRPAAVARDLSGPGFRRNRLPAQYVDTFVDPVAVATFGSRYVFGSMDQTGAEPADARRSGALATDVAAGLHAAARVGRRLRRLQGARAAAHVRLQSIRPGRRHPDVQSGAQHTR